MQDGDTIKVSRARWPKLWHDMVKATRECIAEKEAEQEGVVYFTTYFG